MKLIFILCVLFFVSHFVFSMELAHEDRLEDHLSIKQEEALILWRNYPIMVDPLSRLVQYIQKYNNQKSSTKVKDDALAYIKNHLDEFYKKQHEMMSTDNGWSIVGGKSYCENWQSFIRELKNKKPH